LGGWVSDLSALRAGDPASPAAARSNFSTNASASPSLASPPANDLIAERVGDSPPRRFGDARGDPT